MKLNRRKLCKCGCKEVVNPGRKYINGHNPPGNKGNSKYKSQPCQCGCGRIANVGYRYIYGHQNLGRTIPRNGEWVSLRNWREAVLARDNYTCQKCWLTYQERRLCTHHIKPKEIFPKLKYDIDNGVTLCNSCHSLRHRGGHYPLVRR